MKIDRIITLISVGEFPEQPDWVRSREQLLHCIKSMEHPIGSGKFTIYPESGKKSGKGNGVKPIKEGLMRSLHGLGWELEKKLKIGSKSPGKLDAVLTTPHGLFAVEWETGNISSSHRALNKMVIGMMKNVLIGGALIVPTRKMYKYLTDRIGNIDELEPYFDLWPMYGRSIETGLLEIIVVEHDDESFDVPKIPKGTDGRAKL